MMYTVAMWECALLPYSQISMVTGLPHFTVQPLLSYMVVIKELLTNGEDSFLHIILVFPGVVPCPLTAVAGCKVSISVNHHRES